MRAWLHWKLELSPSGFGPRGVEICKISIFQGSDGWEIFGNSYDCY